MCAVYNLPAGHADSGSLETSNDITRCDRGFELFTVITSYNFKRIGFLVQIVQIFLNVF